MIEPTQHVVYQADSRDLSFVPDRSVHLVVTSPPYGALKRYEEHPDQLGHIEDYEEFLVQLDRVWSECERVLVAGGRIACVVGDICVPRRRGGRHYVLPLSADIQVRARALGLDALTPIRWLKVSNIKLEASNSARFLGKPNLPNGIVKNDLEHILFLRKPGGYRKPTAEMEARSRITTDDYEKWFSPIWRVGGASTREHPAPYPREIAHRLVRMFSFAGDVVLDPFAGTGTTSLAASELGRHSIAVEIEPKYVDLIERRLGREPLGGTEVRFVREPEPAVAAAAA
ncbi:MAG TPA: site-specific DNA-methyltransferase [Conexibacter sp.]|nr:site-specific DNA-methyltransferase [Conexibacter sp.]